MFKIFRIAALIMANSNSWDNPIQVKSFLQKLIVQIKPYAEKTKTTIDDTVLRQIEIILNNDSLFTYVYNLIKEQFASDEILFESVDAKFIAQKLEEACGTGSDMPEAVNPIMLVTFITQILTLINSIKQQ